MKNDVSIFKLLYSGTDSLIYEIGEDFYEIMHKHKEIFDLSNQPKHRKYYCNDNKKVPGKMKDDYGGKIICEITTLKSEMYSIRDVKNNEKAYLKVIIHILVIMNLMILFLTEKSLYIK